MLWPLLVRISYSLIIHYTNILCTGHDSSISIVYPGGPTIYTIRLPSLPAVSLLWTAEDTLIAAGHDCQPYLFNGSDAGWQGVGTLDDSISSKSNAGRPAVPGKLRTGAFATFQAADSRGQSSGLQGSPTADTKVLTIHQNTITSIRPYETAGDRVTRVSTTGVDGNLVIWNVDAVTPLAGKMGALSVR